MFLVFLLLTFKGSLGEGQPTLFSNIIEKYIEETSVSLVGYAQQESSSLSEISALAAISVSASGQGGPDTTIIPLPINDNSFLAHNPTSTDYLDTIAAKRNEVVEYEVQVGDLLSFIASDFGVSVNSVIWANKLASADSIRPGQILKIPPVSGVIHKIAKNDTVGSIAKKYGAEASKIIEFNSLPQSGELAVGDEIMVPGGQIKSASTGIATSGSARTFSYLPNVNSYFVHPTGGVGYNWRRIHGRNGVDVANPCGTDIFAAADGIVAIADAVGYNGGFGKYIKIIHKGPGGTNLETLYAHASKLLVSVGEYVQRGQHIAEMGTTGRSTGCHLHFEVHGARNPLLDW